jgi:hypothetical protein
VDALDAGGGRRVHHTHSAGSVNHKSALGGDQRVDPHSCRQASPLAGLNTRKHTHAHCAGSGACCQAEPRGRTPLDAGRGRHTTASGAPHAPAIIERNSPQPSITTLARTCMMPAAGQTAKQSAWGATKGSTPKAASTQTHYELAAGHAAKQPGCRSPLTARPGRRTTANGGTTGSPPASPTPRVNDDSSSHSLTPCSASRGSCCQAARGPDSPGYKAWPNTQLQAGHSPHTLIIMTTASQRTCISTHTLLHANYTQTLLQAEGQPGGRPRVDPQSCKHTNTL